MKYLTILLFAVWMSPAVAKGLTQPKSIMCEVDDLYLLITAEQGSVAPATANLIMEKNGKKIYEGVFTVSVNQGNTLTSYHYKGYNHFDGSLIVLGDDIFGTGSFFIETKEGVFSRERSANCRINQE